MEILAPAKINLSLDVVGRRADGYHLLRTVMQSISLCDTVSLSASGQGKAEAFCDDRSISPGENTVLRAAQAFSQETGLRGNDGLRFTVRKRIPTQAGLGGGSADAAAALKLLNTFYGAGISEERLRRIGLMVGADVPFCLMGGTALAEGIGEKLQKVPSLPPCEIVVCRPKTGVCTGRAYEIFDGCRAKPPVGTDGLLKALHAGRLNEIGKCLSNAFAHTGVSSETGRICGVMMGFHAAGASMTGSGSAAFGLFDGKEKALACREFLAARYPSTFCCEPVSE